MSSAGAAPAALVIALVSMAILPGFMEELLFRGILFRWLEEFGGSWFALALTSALFGLGHIFNPGATALSSFAIALEAGVLLGGGLHADPQFVGGDRAARGVEFHPRLHLRRAGFGD